jgi:hypothetical protein
MTTYKAKKIISRMLRYYDGQPEALTDEYRAVINTKNSQMLDDVTVFINEFKGRKREKLKQYALDVIKSKAGR